jgi:hypothetical protein
MSPVAIRMTWTALPITSAGRFSPLGPRGMGTPGRFNKHIQLFGQHLPSDFSDRMPFCDQSFFNVFDRGAATQPGELESAL